MRKCVKWCARDGTLVVAIERLTRTSIRRKVKFFFRHSLGLPVFDRFLPGALVISRKFEDLVMIDDEDGISAPKVGIPTWQHVGLQSVYLFP